MFMKKNGKSIFINKNNKVQLDKVVILKSYLTAKARIEIVNYNDKLYFVKEKNNSFKTELKNYEKIKKYYRVPRFVLDCGEYVVYDYVSDFSDKTINDYLYGTMGDIDFNNVLLQYEKSIDNTLKLKKESLCVSKRFFNDRSYMIKEIIEKLEYKNIVYNNKKINISNILHDVLYNITLDKKMYSFLSQGDPTDTNITTTGYFTDFENVGYNILVGEFSIMFVSLFSHGRYFYPKYNKKAYVINKAIVDKYYKYKMNLNYSIVNNDIKIESISINLPSKNKELILQYINFYLQNKYFSKYSNDFKYLKYYICMRLLTPININNMDEIDKITILVLVVIVYLYVDDLIKLKELIERW